MPRVNYAAAHHAAPPMGRPPMTGGGVAMQRMANRLSGGAHHFHGPSAFTGQEVPYAFGHARGSSGMARHPHAMPPAHAAAGRNLHRMHGEDDPNEWWEATFGVELPSVAGYHLPVTPKLIGSAVAGGAAGVAAHQMIGLALGPAAIVGLAVFAGLVVGLKQYTKS